MSLINQMLKDLDARHEAGVRGRLHREIRALPAADRNRNLLRAILVLLLLAFVGGGWWVYERGLASLAGHVLPEPSPVPAPPPSSASSPAPSPVPSPAPVPAAAPPPGAAPAPADVAPPTAAPAAPAVPGEAKSPAASGRAANGKAGEAKPSAPAARRPPLPADDAAAVTKASPEASEAVGAIEKRPASGKTGRDRADADYRRAVSLVNGARVSEAIDLLLDVLRQDGSHVASRQLAARLLTEQRRYDEAMAILAEGLSSQPGQVAWAMQLARLQVERGDAAAAARTLLVSQPYAAANAEYLGFAGLVQLRLGRAKEAAELYQSATRAAPSEGRWWLGLGLALEADRQAAEARDAFLRARATGTLSPDLAAVVEQKLR